MKQFAVQYVTRLSGHQVEYGPVFHVNDPAAIEFPLTGDFIAGEYDATIDRMAIGESRTFVPQAAMHDTHILDRFDEIPRDLRTATRVTRVR